MLNPCKGKGMTDFGRITKYYASFDEWERLEKPSGKLEFLRTVQIVNKYVKKQSKILDLGSGPGHYTIEFASKGTNP